jgi:hypothetical protein
MITTECHLKGSSKFSQSSLTLQPVDLFLV